MKIKELGLYVVCDEYLEKYYLKNYPTNKVDGERPFFICFKDNKNNDIYWIIPISSQIDKYKDIFKKYPNAGVIMHLFGEKDSAILTQNIVPIHKNLIKREFTVSKIPFKILKKESIKIILKKARHVRALISQNKIHNSSEVKDLYDKMVNYKKTS